MRDTQLCHVIPTEIKCQVTTHLCVCGGGGGVQERLGVEAMPVELYLRETGTPDWLSMVSHDSDTSLVTMTVCVCVCVCECV